MRLLLFIVLSAVLLVTTSALPHRRSLRIPIHKKSNLVENGRVDIDRLGSHLAYAEQKYAKGAAALEYYTDRSSSSEPSNRHAFGGDGKSIQLVDVQDTYWYGTVSVGSPPVEYTVDFDTGSSDLILPSTACDATCDGHTRYDPNASSSAVDLYRPFEITYGDGSKLAGEQYTETVDIAGYVADTQTIGAALQYTGNFLSSNSAADGIMGLAFPSISVMQANPVVQTLIAEEQLSDPVFAFKLAASGAELYLGGVNESLYTGSITYTDVTQQGFWKINVASIDVDGQAIGENISAIVDTGTTLILADTQTVNQFYASLHGTSIGNGLYTIPCDAMPSLSFTIEGKSISIPPEMFNHGSYDASGKECVGSLAAMNIFEGAWVLGDVFLRNVYTVFDIGESRVGFADLA